MHRRVLREARAPIGVLLPLFREPTVTVRLFDQNTDPSTDACCERGTLPLFGQNIDPSTHTRAAVGVLYLFLAKLP